MKTNDELRLLFFPTFKIVLAPHKTWVAECNHVCIVLMPLSTFTLNFAKKSACDNVKYYVKIILLSINFPNFNLSFCTDESVFTHR